MNKVMILAILVAYKAFNDKSLSIVVHDGSDEYCFNNITIKSITDNGIIQFEYIDNDAEQYIMRTVWLDNVIGVQFQG